MTYYTGGITTTLNADEIIWKLNTITSSGINIVELKGGDNMEYLYQIFLVEKNRAVHTFDVTVAKNEEEAKFNAGVYDQLGKTGLRLSDVTVIVKNLGLVKVEDEKIEVK